MSDATKPAYWTKAKRHLMKADPVMATLIGQYQGETLTSRGSAFYSLARAIVGQQISVKAAESVWTKLELALGGTVQPEWIRLATDEALRAAGLSGRKVLYLREIACFFLRDTTPDWHTKHDEEVIRDLIAIKGIGRWSAEMFLIFHLMRPDVFPIADLGVRKAIELQYYDGKPMELFFMLALAEHWRPYRTVATWYLWRSLDPIPVAY